MFCVLCYQVVINGKEVIHDAFMSYDFFIINCRPIYFFIFSLSRPETRPIRRRRTVKGKAKKMIDASHFTGNLSV